MASKMFYHSQLRIIIRETTSERDRRKSKKKEKKKKILSFVELVRCMNEWMNEEIERWNLIEFNHDHKNGEKLWKSLETRIKNRFILVE